MKSNLEIMEELVSWHAYYETRLRVLRNAYVKNGKQEDLLELRITYRFMLFTEEMIKFIEDAPDELEELLKGDEKC